MNLEQIKYEFRRSIILECEIAFFANKLGKMIWFNHRTFDSHYPSESAQHIWELAVRKFSISPHAIISGYHEINQENYEKLVALLDESEFWKKDMTPNNQREKDDIGVDHYVFRANDPTQILKVMNELTAK